MANPGIPEFLVGHVVFVVLFASIFMILALAMVQMKPEKLEDAFQQVRKLSGKTRNVDQKLDFEMGLQKPKKTQPRKLRKVVCFFFGEPIVESGCDESPYELDGEVWMAPANAPAYIAAQQTEAYDFPDNFRSAPLIAVGGHW